MSTSGSTTQCGPSTIAACPRATASPCPTRQSWRLPCSAMTPPPSCATLPTCARAPTSSRRTGSPGAGSTPGPLARAHVRAI
eukprot:4941262-Alexandrium_andersonii.AAC.1